MMFGFAPLTGLLPAAAPAPTDAPMQMAAPTLVGGAEQATLTLSAAPVGAGVFAYFYEITTAADAGFAAVVVADFVAAADRGTPIVVGPLAPAAYIARCWAVNAAGGGPPSPASGSATVTAISRPVEEPPPNAVANRLPLSVTAGQQLGMTIGLNGCFSGGTLPRTVTVSGLPPGLSASGGVIASTQAPAPGSGGVYKVVVTCVDALGASVAVARDMTVLEAAAVASVAIVNDADGSANLTPGALARAVVVDSGWPAPTIEIQWGDQAGGYALGTGETFVVPASGVTQLQCRARVAPSGPWVTATPVTVVGGVILDALARNGGTGYLARTMSSDASPNNLLADSTVQTIAFRALIPASAIGVAQRVWQMAGRGYVQINSDGRLEYWVYNTTNVLIGRFQSSASIALAGERVFVISVNTAAGQISGQVTVDGVAIAGSWLTALAAGTIDHTRAAGMFIGASSLGGNALHADVRLRWFYYSGTVAKDPALFGTAASNVDPATIGDAQVLIRNAAAFVAGDNTGTPQGGGDLDFTPTAGGFTSVAPVIPVAAPFMPDALGSGAQTMGAYATTNTPPVRRVVNRNNSGAGSFRDLVADNAAAIIWFDVGGVIHLESECVIGANKTIIGESAPEPVTFTGSRLTLRGSQIHMTGLRVRTPDVASPPQQAATERDGITVSRGALAPPTDICVYGNSILWTPDESGGIWEAAQRVSFIYNLWAEPFDSPGHTDPERHDYGPYIGGESGDSPSEVTFARNVIASMLNRGPAVAWSTKVAIIENVGHNWSNAGAELYDGCENIDIRNNAYVAGPATAAQGWRAILLSGKTAGATVHISGNTTPSGADFIGYANGSNASFWDFSPTPVAADVYAPTLTAAQVLAQVPAMVGARHGGALDALDQRVIDYVLAGGPSSGPWSTGASVTDPLAHFSLPPTLGLAPRADTNADGIVDAYETAMGAAVGTLSPHTVIDAAAQGLSGVWHGRLQLAHQLHWMRTGQLARTVAAPDAIADAHWSLAARPDATGDKLDVTLFVSPTATPGVTAIEYSTNGGGAWTTLVSGAAGFASAGVYTVSGFTAGVQVSMLLRAVNAQGNGAASAAKAATPASTGGTTLAPDQWRLASAVTDGATMFATVDVEGTAKPKFRLTRVSTGAVTEQEGDLRCPGVFALTGLVASQSYSVEASIDGGATWSAAKTGAPTAQSDTRIGCWADGAASRQLSATPSATGANQSTPLPGGGEWEVVHSATSLYETTYLGPAGGNQVGNWLIYDPLGSADDLKPGEARAISASTPTGTTTFVHLGRAGMAVRPVMALWGLDGDGDPVPFRFDRLMQGGQLPDGRPFVVGPARFVCNGKNPTLVTPDPVRGYAVVSDRGAVICVVARPGIIPPVSAAATDLGLSHAYVRRAAAFDFAAAGWDNTAAAAGGTAGVTVRANFESVGLYWNHSGTSRVKVRFRKQGTTPWYPALDLDYHSKDFSAYSSYMAAKHRGAIFYLEPGTTYEIQLKDGSTYRSFTATTRSYKPAKVSAALGVVNGNVTISRSGNIVSVARAGLSTLTLDVTGGKMAELRNGVVRNGTITFNADTDDVILRDVDVFGAPSSCVIINANCSNIRRVRGSSAIWGRRDQWNQWARHQDNVTRVVGGYPGGLGRISMLGGEVRSPRYSANLWSEDTQVTPQHPWGASVFGGEGRDTAGLRDGQTVIDGLSIVPHPLRSLYDVLGPVGRNTITADQAGGIGPDSVVIWNYISEPADDGAEMEGSSCNLWFAHNRLDIRVRRGGADAIIGQAPAQGPHYGLAIGDVSHGPAYFMRNVYTLEILKSPLYERPAVMKVQPQGDSNLGRIFTYHETGVGKGGAFWARGISGSQVQGATLRLDRANCYYRAGGASSLAASTANYVQDTVGGAAYAHDADMRPTGASLVGAGVSVPNVNDGGPFYVASPNVGALI